MGYAHSGKYLVLAAWLKFNIPARLRFSLFPLPRANCFLPVSLSQSAVRGVEVPERCFVSEEIA